MPKLTAQTALCTMRKFWETYSAVCEVWKWHLGKELSLHTLPKGSAVAPYKGQLAVSFLRNTVLCVTCRLLMLKHLT